MVRCVVVNVCLCVKICMNVYVNVCEFVFVSAVHISVYSEYIFLCEQVCKVLGVRYRLVYRSVSVHKTCTVCVCVSE